MARSFSGERAFLSNFYAHPLKYRGESYLSAEHAYQAAKCAMECDRLIIKAQPTPYHAKKMGRLVLARTDWEDVKVLIMEGVVSAKFFGDVLLASRLKATSPQTLVEVNDWHDIFWGVCDGTCKRQKSHPLGHSMGENHLGKILMKVRSSL